MPGTGLDGVIVCDSEIATIDGEAGVLTFRGYDIHDLAETVSFEEVTYLLWHGDLPSEAEGAAFARELTEQRSVPDGVLDLVATTPAGAHPTATLRTAVSRLGEYDPRQEETGRAADLAKAASLTAKLPTLVAAIARRSGGEGPIPPDPTLGHAANFLYMLTGTEPDPLAAKALDVSLVIYAEHEFNASSFTTRVVTGTQSDLYSSVVAGIGALKGPLHGGAVDEAMKLFQAVGTVSQVRPYIDAALARKAKIPGFGHRVYRTRDPRATHLEKMARELAEQRGDTSLIDVAVALEAYMGEKLQERSYIRANVDYYGAIVFHFLGFPFNAFTNVIAASRIAGWSAHILEQSANNRLIRPRAHYVGATGRKLAEGIRVGGVSRES